MIVIRLMNLKIIRIILDFYFDYAFTSICISLSGCALIFVNGIGLLTATIWFKTITTYLIYYYTNTYQYKTFIYYQNLGVSKKILWGYSLSLDLVLFISLVALTRSIR